MEKVLAAGAALGDLSNRSALWIGQRPYVTAGDNQVFRMDGNVGAFLRLAFVLAAFVGFIALFFCLNDRSFLGEAGRVLQVCGTLAILYSAAMLSVSILTPRTIVSIGDGYCWDLWCVGVEQVKSTRQGASTLYTASVRVFSDANRVRCTQTRQ